MIGIKFGEKFLLVKGKEERERELMCGLEREECIDGRGSENLDE
jgi:hypothetical protein